MAEKKPEKSSLSPFDVLSAEYVFEGRELARLPAPTLPEFALAGRSNVGKSSLLNTLCQRKSLARVSRTPGCTRGILAYELLLRSGMKLHLIDLPGYGFAQRSHDERRGWGPLIEGYLQRRDSLAGVVVLVDLRRGLEHEERELLDVLRHVECPALVAATKSDLLSRAARGAAVNRLATDAKAPVIATSAESGEGRAELLRAMLRWIAPAQNSEPLTAQDGTGSTVEAPPVTNS